MDPNNGYVGRDQMVEIRASQRGYEMSGKIMMSVAVSLVAVFLLVLFLHLLIRWHLLRRASRRSRRRRRRRRRRRLVFSDESRGPAARGLDPDALKSLPVIVYSVSESGGADDVAECAVCLNEFEEGEKVRRLPRCDHCFHIECIDMWFHSNATCPLCRSDVETEKAVPTAANSVLIHAPEALPQPPDSSPSDLCSSCRIEDRTGCSSSTAVGLELTVEVPRYQVEEEVGLGSGLKSPVGRIRAIRRLLSRDLRIHLGGGSVDEPDLERGEVEELAPPPTPPTPPPPPPAQPR